MPTLRLKPGRERSLRRRHPWVFSGAIDRVEGDPQPGETVEVVASDGAWLARAAFSPSSQIRARVWTFVQGRPVDPGFLRERVTQALRRRQAMWPADEVTAYREVHSESDGLPGLVVDRYGEFRVAQFLSAGAEAWRQVLLEELSAHGPCTGIYERSDSEARGREGLAARAGLAWGDEPPETVEVREYDLRFSVDIRHGQKTGAYLDQRESRRLVRRIAPGASVLDGFAYAGGFSTAALAGGAERVLAIESSEAALRLAEANLAGNGLPRDRWEGRRGDVFVELRLLRDRGASFDLVILDPPRLAPTAAFVSKAARAYKDVNLLGFKLLRAGGHLVTFSCSGGVGPELFQKIVASAAADAGVEAAIVAWLGQPADHPVGIHFPEARYFKGLVCELR
jgi:23S rRNA (cytosine1962-C5)-methyltransferase